MATGRFRTTDTHPDAPTRPICCDGDTRRIQDPPQGGGRAGRCLRSPPQSAGLPLIMFEQSAFFDDCSHWNSLTLSGQIIFTGAAAHPNQSCGRCGFTSHATPPQSTGALLSWTRRPIRAHSKILIGENLGTRSYVYSMTPIIVEEMRNWRIDSRCTTFPCIRGRLAGAVAPWV